MASKSKVLVIGLDGATPELAEPWLEAGYLPSLENLLRDGSYSRLRSVMPVLSSAAWSSFMTGVNPARHSIYDFVRREPGGYRLQVVQRNHNQSPSLWKLLSHSGRKVVVINVPLTYPPEAVNGVLVTGLGTPDYKPFTHPSSLSQELLKRGYRVNPARYYQPGKEAGYLEEMLSISERQFEAALWLMKEVDWDFFMIVFFNTDQVSHYFWRYMDATHPDYPPGDSSYKDTIFNFYRQMDRYIGALSQAAGNDTNVFVLSDHGHGPYYKDVFLNEWLRQQGYLVTDPGGFQLVGKHQVFARLGITRNRLSHLLRRLHLGRVERWIKDILGQRIDLLPQTGHAEFPEGIDWSRTRAYSFGYQGQIYVNLKGREPQGIVEPGEEYSALCREISQRIRSLVDPQDRMPVVDAVYTREELFAGPFLDYAPDLTLVMRGMSYNTRKGYEFGVEPGKIFGAPINHESSSHRMDGILFAGGPMIQKRGKQTEPARIIDLAPTILHLLDCPIPVHLDGKVLEGWIASPRPVTYENVLPELSHEGQSPPITQAEEEELIDRLKKLGYLE